MPICEECGATIDGQDFVLVMRIESAQPCISIFCSLECVYKGAG